MATGDVEVGVVTPSGKACSFFDGDDDYVEVPHNSNQLGTNLSGGFTICALMNPRSGGESDEGRILDKSNGSNSAEGFHFRITNASSNNRVLFRLNAGTNAISGANAFVNDEWTHVMVTVSSAQIATIYVNGVVSGTPTDLVQTVSSLTTTNAARIGNRSLATDRTFDGGLKDVKMWSKVLDSDEIAFVAAGVNTAVDSQILFARLESDYEDSSSSGLTFTNSGSFFTILEEDIAASIKAARTTANDVFLIATSGNGKQVITSVIEEAP